MRRLHLPHILTLAVGLALLATLSAPAAETSDPVKLVAQLGSADFEEREAAAGALEKLGAPALEALRQGLQSSDPEVRMRSGLLVKKLEARIASTTLLAGKRVHLVYKNVRLSEALADFNKQSGYTLTLADPYGALKDRMVTLDTGEVTFWQALDKFCEAAGVVEYSPYTQVFGQGGGGRPIIRRQIQIAPLQVVPVPVAPPVPAPKPDVQPKVEPKKDDKPAEKQAPEKQNDGKGANLKADPQARPAVVRQNRTVQAQQVQVQQAVPAQPPVQVQQLQFQVQGQVQVLQVQIQPGGGFAANPGLAINPNQPNQGIILVDGKSVNLPTDATGAIRVRALERADIIGQPNEKEILLALQATPEPKLQCQILPNVRIIKAIDENGQNLVVATQTDPENDPNLPPNPPGLRPGRVMRPGVVRMQPQQIENILAVRLKAGAQPTKVIKELRGVLTAHMLGEAQSVITADDILKATGKTFKGGENGVLRILELKEADGLLTIRFEFEAPRDIVAANIAENQVAPPAPIQPPQPALQVRPILKAPAVPQPAIQPVPPPVPAQAPAVAPVSNFGFTLLDEKGNALPLVNWNPKDPGVKEYRMTFRTGKSTPTRLVFNGQRTLTLEVPFTLKDVNVP